MFCGHPRPRRIFFYYKFSSIISMAKQWHGISPTRSAPVASPLQDPYHRRCRLLVGCCVLPSTRPSKVNDLPISLIFSLINLSPQTRSSRPPHMFLPSLPFSPTYPLTSTLTPIGLLCPGQMAPKAETPPPLFRWVPFWLPKQGDQKQCAGTRAPGACNGLTGSCGATIRAHGGWFHGEGGRSR